MREPNDGIDRWRPVVALPVVYLAALATVWLVAAATLADLGTTSEMAQDIMGLAGQLPARPVQLVGVPVAAAATAMFLLARQRAFWGVATGVTVTAAAAAYVAL